MNRLPELLLNYIDVFRGRAFPIEQNNKNITELVLYFNELQQRINKAIDYIEKKSYTTYETIDDINFYIVRLDTCEDLLDILKGVDTE